MREAGFAIKICPKSHLRDVHSDGIIGLPYGVHGPVDARDVIIFDIESKSEVS